MIWIVPALAVFALLMLSWLRAVLYHGRGRWVGVPRPNNVVYLSAYRRSTP